MHTKHKKTCFLAVLFLFVVCLLLLHRQTFQPNQITLASIPQKPATAAPSIPSTPLPQQQQLASFQLQCHKVRASCPPPYAPSLARKRASAAGSRQDTVTSGGSKRASARRVQWVDGRKVAAAESLSVDNCERKCLTLWDCANIFQHAQLHAPSAAPLVDLCGRPVAVGDMKVYERAKQRQFTDCETQDEVVVLDLFTHRIGFGSLLVHEVVDAVIRAYNRGWRIVLRGCGLPMGYLPELFYPSFGCEENGEEADGQRYYLAAGRHSKRLGVFLNGQPTSRSLPRWQQLRRRDEDKVKQLLLLYLRPSVVVQRHAIDMLHSMGLKCGDDFIGVHFRLGDKLVEEAQWRGTGAFIQVLNETVMSSGLRQVVGISDSQDFLQYFNRTVKKLGVKWRFAFHGQVNGGECVTQGKFCGHSARAFGRLSFEKRRIETLGLASSVVLMTLANTFVGTASSNLFQLIQLLRVQPASTIVDIESYNLTTMHDYGLD